MSDSYDVIVIGAGPAGYPCAIRAAQNVLAVLKRDGDTNAIEDQLATFNDRSSGAIKIIVTP